MARSRRHRDDRRKAPTPMLSRHALHTGRRRAGRREAETMVFVDQHGAGLFLVVTGVVALNILDAFFTVLFLSHGGTELNPIVDWVLRLGLWPFIIAKSLGIGFCLGFLTVTKNFRAARCGLAVVLVGYLALLGWHLHLLGLAGLS